MVLLCVISVAAPLFLPKLESEYQLVVPVACERALLIWLVGGRLGMASAGMDALVDPAIIIDGRDTPSSLSVAGASSCGGDAVE